MNKRCRLQQGVTSAVSFINGSRAALVLFNASTREEGSVGGQGGGEGRACLSEMRTREQSVAITMRRDGSCGRNSRGESVSRDRTRVNYACNSRQDKRAEKGRRSLEFGSLEISQDVLLVARRTTSPFFASRTIFVAACSEYTLNQCRKRRWHGGAKSVNNRAYCLWRHRSPSPFFPGEG